MVEVDAFPTLEAKPENLAPHRHHVTSADLLARARRSEPEAVARLYREHLAALRAFSQRLVGDRESAEDVVHDVFLRLPELLVSFRENCTLRTFLMAVAANRCRSQITTAARRRSALSRGAALQKPDGPGPDELLQRRQSTHAVGQALDRLPDKLRRALVLVTIEQRTHAETAEILGIPEATVRTRCHNARKKLRQWLPAEVYT